VICGKSRAARCFMHESFESCEQRGGLFDHLAPQFYLLGVCWTSIVRDHSFVSGSYDAVTSRLVVLPLKRVTSVSRVYPDSVRVSSSLKVRVLPSGRVSTTSRERVRASRSLTTVASRVTTLPRSFVHTSRRVCPGSVR